MDLEAIYQKRFDAEERSEKKMLWQCLVDSYLQQYFGSEGTIIDLGCGFCEFINAVRGAKKYGYDLEGAFAEYAAEDVEFIKAADGTPIPLPDNTCDRAFASNFFEHLSSREEVLFILRETCRILRPGGKIIAIQPNIALLGGAYWDFFDHIIPLTDKSLVEAMEAVGFTAPYVKRRFLPYTTKSGRGGSVILLKVYLAIPVFQQVFGKQSLIIAEKPRG